MALRDRFTSIGLIVDLSLGNSVSCQYIVTTTRICRPLSNRRRVGHYGKKLGKLADAPQTLISCKNCQIFVRFLIHNSFLSSELIYRLADRLSTVAARIYCGSQPRSKLPRRSYLLNRVNYVFRRQFQVIIKICPGLSEMMIS